MAEPEKKSSVNIRMYYDAGKRTFNKRDSYA